MPRGMAGSMWTLAIALVLGGGLLYAPRAVLSDEEHEHAEETELMEHMEVLKRHFRHLKEQVENPAHNEDSLARVQAMEMHAIEAKTLVPVKVQELPEAERARALLGFRKQMVRLVEELLALEVILLEGRNDEALAQLKTVYEVMKQGREKYKKEDL